MKKRIADSFFPIIIFLIFALSLGSLYLKNVGPKSVGDYDMQMYNTYVVATGKMNKHFKNDSTSYDIKKMIFYGPANLLSLDGADNSYPNKVLSPFSKDDQLDIQLKSFKSLTSSNIEKLDRTQYPPLNWLIQAIGMKVGLITKVSPYLTWQMARIANLIGFIIIISCAILLVPRGKWLFAAIGSFPLSIFLGSSLSADAVNISISALLVAYVLYLRDKALQSNGKISNLKMLLLMLLVIIFFNLKVAYVPMLIIILLVPNSFYTLKQKIVTLGISGTVGLTSYLLWSHTYSTVFTSFGSLSQNLAFVKDHLMSAIYSVIVFTINMPFFLSGIGNADNWSKVGVLTTLFMIFILIVALAFNINSFKEAELFTLSEKINHYSPILLGLVAYFGSMLILSMVLLMTWTKVYPGGSGYTYIMNDIQGFQSRYFLPIMPLFALIYALSDNKYFHDKD